MSAGASSLPPALRAAIDEVLTRAALDEDAEREVRADLEQPPPPWAPSWRA